MGGVGPVAAAAGVAAMLNAAGAAECPRVAPAVAWVSVPRYHCRLNIRSCAPVFFATMTRDPAGKVPLEGASTYSPGFCVPSWVLVEAPSTSSSVGSSTYKS
ncbi:MAG: hypothetical protein IPI73_19650 [Betaproteobacteria bacterium]|nr:hypothetical protein [Betaproteobacteria bacterium]